MRKLLTLMLGLTLVGIMTYGAVGSAAWFSDSDQTPVTATAGTLSVHLTGADHTSITVGPMEPGVWSGVYDIDVTNDNAPASTMDAKYKFTSANLTGGLDDLLWVRMTHTNCVNGADRSTWPIVYGPVKVSALNFRSTATHPNPIVNGGILPVWYSHCYGFEFLLDKSADNTYQGMTETFDLVMYATQVAAPW